MSLGDNNHGLITGAGGVGPFLVRFFRNFICQSHRLDIVRVS